MNISKVLLVAIVAVTLCSCNYQKKLHEMLYFHDKIDSSHRMVAEYTARVKVDDRLAIQITALNPESALPYNSATSTGASTVGSTSGYIVEKNGTILYPQLGRIKVEGKTLLEVRDTIIQIAAKYLMDPVVTVQFSNARILVMGEVTKPGSIPIPDGKLTIFEAITLSGDIPPTGRKDNVLVIREENGIRTFNRIDVRSNEVLKSPYFFLRQNDLIYVEVNEHKAKEIAQRSFIADLAPITAMTSVFTILVLLLNYFRR